MPKKYPAEVRKRAVRMALDHASDYSSISALATALAPKLNVGVETQRKWVVQTQIDAGEKTGTSSWSSRKPRRSSVK